VIGTDAPIFGRMVTAMVTPFGDDGKIDYKATEKVADHLIKTGTSTILICGTTGENPTLTDEEKLDLLKCVVSICKKRGKVIMGAGTNDTEKSVKLVQIAQKEGADGLLVVAPYYNKPNQAGIEAHIKKIASASTLPMIVYNIPSRTGVNILPETMLRIAEQCDTVHAIKDSTGNVDQAAEIAAGAPDKFRIYSGDDYLTLPFLSVGACGVISVASHVVGEGISGIMAKFFSGDVDGPRALHYKYLPLFKGLFSAPNPVCVKYALSKLGLCKEHVRLPLVPLTEEEKTVLKQILKNTGVLENLSYV
jgi:4-hydroxy-tetrahydrodipicolinate synthase